MTFYNKQQTFPFDMALMQDVNEIEDFVPTDAAMWIAGTTDVVEQTGDAIAIGANQNLNPASTGSERALIIDFTSYTAARAGIIQVTVQQSGTDPILKYPLQQGFPQRIALFISHASDQIDFELLTAPVGATFSYQAFYGPAIFRPMNQWV